MASVRVPPEPFLVTFHLFFVGRLGLVRLGFSNRVSVTVSGYNADLYGIGNRNIIVLCVLYPSF